MPIRKTIQRMIQDIVGSDVPFSVTFQEVLGRGDYTSNVAMMLANENFHTLPSNLSSVNTARKNPERIAHEIGDLLMKNNPHVFASVAVAAPGFLNLTLAETFLTHAVQNFVKGEKVKKLGRASVEFVSANPTGPLHIGNARGGPIGDAIANVLAETGYKVTREYFHNDAGAQVKKFSDSLWYWYSVSCGEKHTETSARDTVEYQGEYVRVLARDALKKYGEKLLREKNGEDTLLKFAFKKLYKENFETLSRLGIYFDKIVLESKLKNKTKKALTELKEKSLLKEKDGAVWFVPKTVSEEKNSDKESVVQKSDGTYLYFANDIAYHKEKFSKNDLVVDVLGEGHHGHIPKLRAVADVFGFKQENFYVVVHGQVNLLRGGKKVSMSKRTGNFVTAREVLDEVGSDVFRYFFLQYSPRTAMNFDMTLACEQSKKNPVYYVQYAHARTVSILKKSGARPRLRNANWHLLTTRHEHELVKHILYYKEVLADTARDFEIQHLTRYTHDLARVFTEFYEHVRVIGEKPDLENARLALVALTRDIIRRALRLLGVSAPDQM